MDLQRESEGIIDYIRNNYLYIYTCKFKTKLTAPGRFLPDRPSLDWLLKTRYSDHFEPLVGWQAIVSHSQGHEATVSNLGTNMEATSTQLLSRFSVPLDQIQSTVGAFDLVRGFNLEAAGCGLLSHSSTACFPPAVLLKQDERLRESNGSVIPMEIIGC